MKNKLANTGVRIGAFIAGTISVVLMVAGGLGMVATYALDTEEDVLNRGYENIAQNYSAYILDEIFSNPEEVQERLAETNLHYAVIKDLSLEDGIHILEDTSTYVYSNMPSLDVDNDGLYYYEGGEGDSHEYHIESLLDTFNEPYEMGYGEKPRKEVDLQQIVLDVTEGLFYLKTEDGYFLADYIWIQDESGTWNKYYRGRGDVANSYFNEAGGPKLDVQSYITWSQISMEYAGYSVDDENFKVVDDNTEIMQNLLAGDYWVEGDQLIYEYEAEPEPVYMVITKVAPTLEKDDFIKEWHDKVTFLFSVREMFPLCLLLGIVLFVASIVILIRTAKGDKEELRFVHKCPIFIYLCAVGMAEVCMVLLAEGVFYLAVAWDYKISVNELVFMFAGIVAVMAFLFFRLVSNLTTRIKTRTLYRYSELYYIMKPIKSLWRRIKNKLAEFRKLISENVPLFWKVTLSVGVVDLIELWVLAAGLRYDLQGLIVLFLIYKLVQFVVIVSLAMQMSQLQKGAKRIAEGDLTPIDTEKMFGDLKIHGENINRVGDGIAKAVEERLKSERLKTELITNVSHDIKTPLTSIINYVDLIKKENITDATLLEYVDVLDRQSARLKKLIEDLMEASKASTGNLKVELEDCDISMLIGQVAGEFEDRFAVNGLETIILKPEEPVYIQADGRHIWRVLDNLMNNINKYSLPNSRVYIQLQQNGDKAILQFKNISKSQLNISSDELMERFVRGDSSRNTEGSGLGLSIAQSLTELMQGSMTLDIDGDLFKVTLTFPVYHKPVVITE